jgi:hypothetical protein
MIVTENAEEIVWEPTSSFRNFLMFPIGPPSQIVRGCIRRIEEGENPPIILDGMTRAPVKDKENLTTLEAYFRIRSSYVPTKVK